MPAKKKQTEQELKLKALILDMTEVLGDSQIKIFLSRMNSCGISTSSILCALGYPIIDADVLKPGVWVKLYWYDADPTWCLLLESPDKKGGKETSIKVFDPNTEDVHSHATLSQVIDYETTLIAPAR